jgi:hypothetical protein
MNSSQHSKTRHYTDVSFTLWPLYLRLWELWAGWRRDQSLFIPYIEPQPPSSQPVTSGPRYPGWYTAIIRCFSRSTIFSPWACHVSCLVSCGHTGNSRTSYFRYRSYRTYTRRHGFVICTVCKDCGSHLSVVVLWIYEVLRAASYTSETSAISPITAQNNNPVTPVEYLSKFCMLKKFYFTQHSLKYNPVSLV